MYTFDDELGTNIFSAGQRVPAGRYVRIDTIHSRTINFDAEDVLPASMDGRVAVYRRTELYSSQHNIRPRFAEIVTQYAIAGE